MASEKVTNFIEEIKKLSVMELNDLVHALEEEFGVSAAMMAAPAAGGAAAVAVEEQTEFTVILKNPGAAKINVIKTIRQITGLGLKEAKALADETPSKIKENVEKAEAEDIVAKLKEAGAEVEIK